MSNFLKFILIVMFAIGFAGVVMFDRAMSGKDDFGLLSNDTNGQKKPYQIKKSVTDDQDKIRESREKRGERIDALKEVGRELSGNTN
ncbi:MAG: hypothetical protein HY307_00835 [Arcobacter sp.]|nr:hypothetical protein [Arcobacter sp.]